MPHATGTAGQTALIVVRHGQTQVVPGRIQGQFNSQLDDLGRRQCALLAARLRGCRFDACYASDLDRAVETARAVVGARELVLEPRLREWSMGAWEGMQWSEVERRYPAAFAAFHKGEAAAPGGETLPQMLRRVADTFEDLARRHVGGVVFVATHGGVLRQLLHHLAGSVGFLGDSLSDNTSINRFTWFAEGRWRLDCWNDTAHLTPAPPHSSNGGSLSPPPMSGTPPA
jgi:broad specificity phosphatase PhoE